MNSLKKALAIFMTVLMVVSMMNVGTSAATYTATIQAGSGEGSTLKEGITEDMLILTSNSSGRITLPDEAYFERENYVQDGWTRIASGSGTLLKFGSLQTVRSNTTKFYPHWKQLIYTITFSAGSYYDNTDVRNYTDSTKSTLLSATTKTDGTSEQPVVFPEAMFYRVGYTQTGWTKTKSGTGTKYEFGSIYDGTISADVNFYPYWTINTYTVTYLPGQYGMETESSVSKNYNSRFALEDAIFTREGYIQTGWSLVDGGDMVYDLGATITMGTEDIAVYPYWTKNECGSNLTHTWENGICTVCGVVCGTGVEHSWKNGICTICNAVCGTDTEHAWENGVCSICGAVCGTDTEHVFEDCICKICGIVCGTDMEHIWEMGACSTCGFSCVHSYENGICPVCGDCEPAILVTTENYAELDLSDSYIGYYAIGNLGQLHWFSNFVNSNKQLSGADTTDDITDDVYSTSANGVLINDIDMNPEYIITLVDATTGAIGVYDKNGEQLPDGSINLLFWENGIGSSSSAAYSGVFDGNSFSIKDFMAVDNGLFIYNNGTIRNLNIEYGQGVSFSNYIGAICWVNYGEVLNCSSYVFCAAPEGVSGNICGYNSGTISECVNFGLVGNESAGGSAGICGKNDGVISGCTNYGNIYLGVGICAENYGTITHSRNMADFLESQDASGICAYNGGNIEFCYNVGNIKAKDGASGICAESVAGTIKNCYNTGIFTSGGSYVGAICGTSTDTTIENCYYLEGCATDGEGVVQFGIGNATLGAVTEDVDGATIAKSAEQFASGEVCYLLNGGIIDGTQAFYQNIDNGEEINATPVFSGVTVHKVGPCTGVKEYTNIEEDIVWEHNWEHGICSNCELVCEHIWENGKCTICKSVCGTDIEHIWENGECKICDAICGIDVAHTWKEGVCSVCGAVCEHDSFDFNGFCAECGVAYEPAILVTEDNYISLNLTEDYIGYYAIKNAGQLYWFSEFVNSHTQLSGIDTADDTTDDIFSNSANAVLLNDIDINPGYAFNSDGTVTYNGETVTEGYREWIPIGSIENEVFYNGVFDGNIHCIKGVYINTEDDFAALFLVTLGTIKDLGVENGYIEGADYVAGICVSNGGLIDSCYNSIVVKGQESVAGICTGSSGVIDSCYNTAIVEGDIIVGGIVAENSNEINNCYNTGAVFAYGYSGGICGHSSSGSITNSYNEGNITGINEEDVESIVIGGICGYSEETDFSNCYNTGIISGYSLVAGITCSNNGGSNVSACYNTGVIEAVEEAAGIVFTNGGTVNLCYNTGSVIAGINAGGVCANSVGTISHCYNTGKIENTEIFDDTSHGTGGICANISGGDIYNCYNTGEIIATNNNYAQIPTYCGGICGVAEEGSISTSHNTGKVGGSEVVGGICGYNLGGDFSNCYYLEGCATDETDTVYGGIGENEDSEDTTISKTSEQFASGEVCYLLNEGATDGTQTFYQNLDNSEESDSIPVFSGGTVYKVGPCIGIKEYTNIEADVVCEHIWENDVCLTCGLSMLKSVSDKTKIDHTGKSIFTKLLLCKSLDEIATAIEGYTIKLTASFGDYIGTGSTVEVLDSDANTVSTYTVVVENDVNGDSVCDVLDCAQVARVTSGYDSFEGAYKLAADSDCNNEIDVNDYQAIVNAALQ